MSETCCVRLATLEDFDLAVARFDLNGVLSYQNRAAARLFGVRVEDHLDIQMLLPNKAELEHVIQQIHTRSQGKSSVYRTAFHQPHAAPDAPDIPISVFAFPDTNADGQAVGSITLIRDLREETVRESLHHIIETSTANEELFARLTGQLRLLLEFDELRVVTISKGGAHLRQLYSSDPQAASKYTFRWWPMPPFLKETLHERTPEIIKVSDMLADPNYQQLLARDAATRDFFQSGVEQILSLPVYEENRIAAFFNLHSRVADRYSAEALRLVQRLPVAQAVLSAIGREEREQQRLVLQLIRDIGTLSTDVQGAARILVDRLVKDFGWDHVSIFQHDPCSEQHWLVFQANHPEKPALPEHYAITAPRGMAAPASDMGAGPAAGDAIVEAASTNRVVSVPATRRRGPFNALPGFDPRGSELVIPISGPKVQWVLNLESSSTNAFADEEVELLQVLASEACLALHRSVLFELQKAVLASINDAVIETGTDGRIRWSNRAAKEMLGMEAEPAQPQWIADLLDDPAAAALAQASQFYHRETSIRDRDGQAVPVLLSCTTLPDHLGGRVYVASDFRFQKEVQRLSELKEVFRLAAMEGRIPLSLAAVWLGDLAEAVPEQKDCIDKVAAELGRADLPLERLLRLFTSETGAAGTPRADLNLAIATTLAELPRTLLDAIAYSPVKTAAPVGVAFDTLQFCIEAIISFGLRTRPQSRRLEVRSERLGDRVLFRVGGDWRADMGSERAPGPTEQWRRKSLSDLTLGESVIRRTIDNAGGRFCFKPEPALCLEFELPLLPQ